ncbi:RNA polymerase subunit sigma-70, partial [Streptomyces sp. NPDC056948]
MLRGRARRGRETPRAGAGDDPQSGADPLDAAQERRVRAVLALGGVPQADLP